MRKQWAEKPLNSFRVNIFNKQPLIREIQQYRCQNVKDNMVNAMVEYKTEHDFGAAASLDGFPEF